MFVLRMEVLRLNFATNEGVQTIVLTIFVFIFYKKKNSSMEQSHSTSLAGILFLVLFFDIANIKCKKIQKKFTKRLFRIVLL